TMLCFELRGGVMKRRDFITLIGGVATVWPLAAQAPQQPIPVIGFLAGASPDNGGYKRISTEFLQGLQETGYVERQNVAIEYRWAEGPYDSLPVFAPALVHRKARVCR